MIDSNKLRKGTTYQEDGELYKVMDFSHNKTARGGATIKVSVFNLRSGSTTIKTYNSGAKVTDIRLEGTNVQYLYDDGRFLTFMDMNTYEQPQLNREVFGDDVIYLKENMNLKLTSYEGEILDYELPQTLDYEVIEVENAVTGDRANNPQKEIILETGLRIQAPMFVNVGDIVKVNIEKGGEYVTRVDS
ncbi:MAG: elongation factor P [Phototrophicaceae bacterium]